MEVVYKNKQIQKICEINSVAIKKYGIELTKKVQIRIKLIRQFANVEQLISSGLGRCHKLIGNRKNQYALDLIHPYRLIFIVIGEQIQIAEIQEIVDYH